MNLFPPSRPAPPADSAGQLDWLTLIRTERVGPHAFWQLLERFGSAAAALDALPDLARRGGGPPLRPAARRDAEREMAATARLGARLIFAGEPAYPPRLLEVEAPPPVLTVLGDPAIAGPRSVALVGARNASAAGRQMARRLAAGLGAAGICVISGLARGIDAQAHHAALATGTAGVIAGGIDTRYPRENAALYDKLAAQGAIFTEMPLGTEPLARHFPRRNRLISGMALGVVVVEGALRSGSLITARFAAEQGRDVFAVPGSPLDQRAQGANRLIREGAVLVQEAADIIEALEPQLAGHGLLAPEAAPPAPEAPEAPEAREEPGTARPAPPAAGIADDAREAVAALLSPAPVDVDEIVRQSGLSTAAVNAAILELELAARAVRYPGSRVAARA